jgi:hypothetical protein
VFARARESARKIQCLSNVKNIALAINMYLTDYDRLFPTEHNAEARQYIIDYCSATCDSAADCRATGANPYLRHPVILDEYIKNRDVWRCPSARYTKDLAINWGYGTGQWLKYLQDSLAAGACNLNICGAPFPPGWGGNITDSAVQGARLSEWGLKVNIGVYTWMTWHRQMRTGAGALTPESSSSSWTAPLGGHRTLPHRLSRSEARRGLVELLLGQPRNPQVLTAETASRPPTCRSQGPVQSRTWAASASPTARQWMSSGYPLRRRELERLRAGAHAAYGLGVCFSPAATSRPESPSAWTGQATTLQRELQGSPPNGGPASCLTSSPVRSSLLHRGECRKPRHRSPRMSQKQRRAPVQRAP